MKSKFLNFAAVGLFTSASLCFAVPNASWGDLSTYYNVNLSGPPQVSGGNIDGDYKFDKGVETGDLALVNALTSYLSSDGFTVLTRWNPTGSMDFNTVYLKAGNQNAAWDVSGVNWSIYNGLYVTQDIIRNPNGNTHPLLSISHEVLNGDGVRVPDGGTTAILMGLGLVGLSLAVRRFSKA